MAKVAIQNLNKMFDQVHAVKDVNLAIRDKEFVVLVGPSGCGKTTLVGSSSMSASLRNSTCGICHHFLPEPPSSQLAYHK